MYDKQTRIKYRKTVPQRRKKQKVTERRGNGERRERFYDKRNTRKGETEKDRRKTKRRDRKGHG